MPIDPQVKAARRAAGLCCYVRCPNPSPRFDMCREHRLKRKARHRRYMAKKPPAVAIKNAEHLARYHNLRSKGLCAACTSPSPKFTLCIVCREARSVRRNFLNAERRKKALALSA